MIKQKCMEKGIAQFPSIYIAGAAGSGKTAAVRVLLQKHSEISAEVLWMDEEADDPDLLREKLSRIAARMDREPLWLVLENMPQKMNHKVEEAVVRLIRHMPDGSRVLLNRTGASRFRASAAFVGTADVLCFTGSAFIFQGGSQAGWRK